MARSCTAAKTRHRVLDLVADPRNAVRAELANKKPLIMTSEDWRRFRSATECHIYDETLVKP